MKKVYMWQPNYLYGNDAYFPYSIGSLAAYAWSDSSIKKEYELSALFFLRESIDATIKFLEEPFLCAFSCYVWNFEYNKMLAKRIKEKFPSCYIVFGGHHISPQSVKASLACDEMSYVDIFIYDEGEIAFKEVLEALAVNGDLQSIPNISYKPTVGGHVFTERKMVMETNFPSPYLMGTFDHMVQLSEQKNLNFSATLETNRGCPYSCAYCDWGIYKSKIRKFPMERIKAELDWFAEQKIDLVFGADSNFGIFERDEEITDYLLHLNKTYGYPKKFRVSYAKNTSQRIYQINKKLNDQGMCKGATLSFQSLDPLTLSNIGRKNISQDFFSELMAQYYRERIPTYSEIILGLPGETLDSFKQGLSQLLKSGQHDSINIYLCELLPNSIMAQHDYIQRFRIQTLKTRLNQYHCAPEEDDIEELSTIVISNLSLSIEDWTKCYIFSWAIQCFHCLGFTRYIAVYLWYEKGIDYKEFYSELIEYFSINADTITGKNLKNICSILNNFLDNKKNALLAIYDKKFGDILWPLEEGSYLELLYNFEQFYTELKVFLETYSIPNDILTDLLKYQMCSIQQPFCKESNLELQYNWVDFFENNISHYNVKLKKSHSVVSMEQTHVENDWKDFAREIVWYGRKGGSTLRKVGEFYESKETV